jgi:hypothetical protein
MRRFWVAIQESLYLKDRSGPLEDHLLGLPDVPISSLLVIFLLRGTRSCPKRRLSTQFNYRERWGNGLLSAEGHTKFVLSNPLLIPRRPTNKCKSIDGFPVIGHSSIWDTTLCRLRNRFKSMKKYICTLVGAALLVTCERKIETAAPSPTVSPEATATTSREESDTSTSPSPAATP